MTENGGRASMWPNLDLTRRVANDASGVVAGVCQQGCAVYQVVQSSRRLFSTPSIHEALPQWLVDRHILPPFTPRSTRNQRLQHPGLSFVHNNRLYFCNALPLKHNVVLLEYSNAASRTEGIILYHG